MPERLVLRGSAVRLDPLDRADVAGLVLAAGEDRSSYGYTLVPVIAEEMHDYVASALDDEATGWALPFTVRLTDTKRIVGTTRFLDLAYWSGAMAWPPDRPTGEGHGIPSAVEIGSTWLAASVQRTSVNTEAKLLMLSQAFDTWGVARVTFKTDARNQRSRRAIERLGATFEGVRRAHVPATDGSIRDSAYYSILHEEWPSIREAIVARIRHADSSNVSTS